MWPNVICFRASAAVAEFGVSLPQPCAVLAALNAFVLPAVPQDKGPTTTVYIVVAHDLSLYAVVRDVNKPVG